MIIYDLVQVITDFNKDSPLDIIISPSKEKYFEGEGESSNNYQDFVSIVFTNIGIF